MGSNNELKKIEVENDTNLPQLVEIFTYEPFPYYSSFKLKNKDQQT